MNREQRIEYGYNLFKVRADLMKIGIVQPVKQMIDRGLWHEDKNNHNYLSGRITDENFLNALQKLKNVCDA